MRGFREVREIKEKDLGLKKRKEGYRSIKPATTTFQDAKNFWDEVFAAEEKPEPFLETLEAGIQSPFPECFEKPKIIPDTLKARINEEIGNPDIIFPLELPTE